MSSLPEISVSPSPYYLSPSFDMTTPQDDAFLYLSPHRCQPLSKIQRQLSPLRPDDAPVRGQGLERDRFEALLRISRDRNAAVGAKKAVDLRKEVALKVHKNKQLTRRALFLSKVLAPPSPTATFTAKTPPESPAIFHYSLPSPGLISPLAMFEDDCSFARQACEPWVEQVDFRLPENLQSKQVRKTAPTKGVQHIKSLPSLDQITARLATHVNTSSHSLTPHRSERRLPAFLQSKQPVLTVQTPEPTPAVSATKSRPLLSVGTGRLCIPVRSQTIVSSQRVKPCETLPLLPPRSPQSPLTPALQITTTLVPRTSTTSPTELSETNLSLLVESRSRKSQDMLSALRRRTTMPSEQGITGHGRDEWEEERKSKRISAPAELPRRERGGFKHPVLSIPGGF
jgi:hypothetical protein